MGLIGRVNRKIKSFDRRPYEMHRVTKPRRGIHSIRIVNNIAL